MLAWSVVRVSHLRVHRRKIEVHLPCELRAERHGLEVDDHEAAKLEVVEKEVYVEVLVGDLDVDLAPDESEAYAELHQKPLDVVYEPLLELALVSVRTEREEVEDVRVLQRLMREVRLRRR
jgi:hypothetical protein